MKRFTRKISLFVILPTLIGFSLFLLFVNYVSNLTSTYQLDPSISSIYIGDSHVQFAVNDSLISNSSNVATSAESFYFTYYKLQILLNNSPSVKKVYLGLSYHNLSNYYDDYIYGSKSASIAPKYFYLMPHKEQVRIINWNKTKFIYFIKSIVKQGLIKVVKNDYYPFIQGYSTIVKNTKAINYSMEKRLKSQYFTNGIINEFSEINIEYLDRIVSLCKSRNVELYTLNTPLFEYYNKKIPNKYKEKLTEIIQRKQLNNIDLSNFQLNEEYFIPDGDHVSTLGAEATSIELNKARMHNNVYKKQAE